MKQRQPQQQRQRVEEAPKNFIVERRRRTDLTKPGQEHHIRTCDLEGCSEHGNDSRIPEELSAEMFNSELYEMPHFIFKPLPGKEVALSLIIDR